MSDKFLVFDDAGEPRVFTSGTVVTEATHQALRQLIHFIDDGPTGGFPTGMYREVVGTWPLPDGFIWWESS